MPLPEPGLPLGLDAICTTFPVTQPQLASNALTDAGMPWAELGRLGALTALHLDSNCLAELPGQALGGLTSLVGAWLGGLVARGCRGSAWL